ncbi:ABC transporter substrate-binding protein [Hymenobacter glacieicola]|uniref:Solute-binding protein family 5 domain-containing protein n=1 Tax=Hymenobacter glacieicola TaxID=1562124 RepID=A0ABQ1WI74_9BACT|nr:ABC transporter substrate-binding protein [Hymenobacter glacieicola]GGG30934.1 hypothetical protein GCM10011378_04430 [Hymenobacter glacieicola]
MKQLLPGLILLLWASLCSSCSPTPAETSSTIRIRWARDPENLDPLIVDNPSANETINLLHCSLLQASEAARGYTPWLAAAMPTTQALNDSLLLITYQIRPEATWDNGSPVLARDVAFTLKVMNCPGLPIEIAQAHYGVIRDIRLDPQDSRRFTLVCVGQDVGTSGDYAILPEYALDPQGKLRTVSVPELRRQQQPALAAEFARRYQSLELARHPERAPGCGPYRLVKWQNGRSLTLQRKTSWWADKLSAPPAVLQAFPERLTFQVIPDAATATLALRRGELDLYSLMPAGEFARLQQSATDTQRLQFHTIDSYQFLTASFNVRRPALQNRLTRQALTHLFNVPALIQASQQGAAYPSVSLISPRLKPYYNDSLPLPDFNPAQAVQLLQQAGWQRSATGSWLRGTTAQPVLLKLSVSYRAGEPSFETAALQFRAAATALGIPVELRPTEPSLLSRQVRAGETDILINNLSGQPFSYDFTSLLHSSSVGVSNFTGFSNPAADNLIEQLVATQQPARKIILLRRFQRLLAQERPFTVLYFLKYRIAATRRLGHIPVTGLKPGYEAARIRPLPLPVQ